MASRSISPIRRPPCAPRPPVGWWVLCSRRPLPRAFHLSSTMCFRRIEKMGPINMSTVCCLPPTPSYIISLPNFSKPSCSKALFICFVKRPSSVNAVPSAIAPTFAAIFPITISITWPIVIREGMAWVFIIISGTIPFAVLGKS